jgi:hypothetical protein
LEKLLEILSWAIFALAILLNIFNLLVISHHGYLVKHFKHPTGIRRTEIKRYSKFIAFLAIIVLILFFTAFLINEDLGVYIFGSFLLKFSIPIFFWIQGWFLPKRLKPQKV